MSCKELKFNVMYVIPFMNFISQESLTRIHKRIHIDTCTKAWSIYISVSFTCSFIIIIQMAQFMFFCIESMSSRFNNEWHEKFNFCESMRQLFLCRISCSPSHKWFCFFKISPLLAYHIIQRRSTMRESRFSSCQSKNVLWWVEWSRLVKNGDFFLFTLRRWIVHVFCARMFLLCLIPFLTYKKCFRRMIFFKSFY